MALLNRAIRNARAMMRANEWGDSSIPPNSMAGAMPSGASGSSEQAALAISAYLSCVKALSDDTGIMEFGAFQGRRDGAHKLIPNQPRIVTEPFGPDLEPGAGFGQLVVSNAMRGNGYAYVVDIDRSTGLPDQLLVLHPDAVTPRRTAKGKRFMIGGEEFGPNEIIHICGLMMPGAIAGIDLLSYQRITWQLAHDVGAYAQGFFGGGGSPAGVISVPGKGGRKEAREVKEAWEASHAGVHNAHRPAVLFGSAKWEAMTVTPENAQFLETRRFLREEICGLFSVPLQRIQAITDNASQGGGAGLDAIDAQYVKHGLLPTVIPIERAWRRLIPGGDSTWCGFDFDEFLRANAKTRAEIAQIHRVIGARTRDEIRGDEGWEPLPDGKGADPDSPLNSNASPTGGADNAPSPTAQGGQ